MDVSRTTAIILAAGKGTRMKSDLPKVLHPVCGRPMLAYVLDACRSAGVSDCFVVVGYGKDDVIAAFRDDRDAHWVEQTEQLGTGHAVLCARAEVLGKYEHALVLGKYEHTLVLCGDGPLIRAETIQTLLKKHSTENAAATLATSVLDDPTGYGRIVRDSEGKLVGIVEQNDCTPEQRQIREVNPSYYCFRVADLFAALAQVKPNNVKYEYYLTDAIAILIGEGRRVQAVTAVPPEDIFAINSPEELALVSGIMRERASHACGVGGAR